MTAKELVESVERHDAAMSPPPWAHGVFGRRHHVEGPMVDGEADIFGTRS